MSTHRIFSWLLLAQWIFAMVFAAIVCPFTYSGGERSLHPHVYISVFLGGLLNSLPWLMIRYRPASPLTQHVVTVAQMLWSSIFIHLMNGRIESHFHVFGSLAFV